MRIGIARRQDRDRLRSDLQLGDVAVPALARLEHELVDAGRIRQARLKALLENYSIDGYPVFDRSNPMHRARLKEIMAALDPTAPDENGQGTMETCRSIKSRTQDLRLITDDNMGEEWQQVSIARIAHGLISMLRNPWKR